MTLQVRLSEQLPFEQKPDWNGGGGKENASPRGGSERGEHQEQGRAQRATIDTVDQQKSQLGEG